VYSTNADCSQSNKLRTTGISSVAGASVPAADVGCCGAASASSSLSLWSSALAAGRPVCDLAMSAVDSAFLDGRSVLQTEQSD